jgi:hypothetical protein
MIGVNVMESEATSFFETVESDFDISQPLRWSFILAGASENQVGSMIERLSALGFTEVNPDFDDEDQGTYALVAEQIAVHDANTFLAMLQQVKRLAASEQVMVADYSAGLPD